MNCSYSRAQLNRHIDAELGYLEVAELQCHLDSCSACAAELAEVGALRRALADWGERELSPTPGFVERVAASAEAQATGTRASATFRWAVEDALQPIDELLGRVVLPGGRAVPVRKLVGWGLAAVAVAVGIERRHVRRGRELETS